MISNFVFRSLNNIHPLCVQLYEQGYGGDAAKLAKAAMQIAKERKIDVVLVDTAGRMQDNAPLMAALSSVSTIWTIGDVFILVDPYQQSRPSSVCW